MSTWELLKEKGNEEYRKKNYSNAIKIYSEAIRILFTLIQ